MGARRLELGGDQVDVAALGLGQHDEDGLAPRQGAGQVGAGGGRDVVVAVVDVIRKICSSIRLGIEPMLCSK